MFLKSVNQIKIKTKSTFNFAVQLYIFCDFAAEMSDLPPTVSVHSPTLCRIFWDHSHSAPQDFDVFTSSAVFLFLCTPFSLFAAVVWVGGLGSLGERRPSILRSCLMDQTSSTDNVKDCEGGSSWFLTHTGGNWDEAQGLLPQTFHWEGKLKSGEKTWRTIRICHLVPPPHGLYFLISDLQFFLQFSLLFFPSAPKPAAVPLSPFFLESLWWG